MKSNSQIVHGGGWLAHTTMGRPRARVFGYLSAVWLLVCLVACSLFWNGWMETSGYRAWVCGALFIPLPVLGSRAFVFRRKELPRVIVSHQRNPDHDIRKLY